MTTTTERTSLRAFARLMRVTDKAVRKGVASGRLAKSVGLNTRGTPCIADVELARQEWHQNAAKPPAGSGTASLAAAQQVVAIQRARGLQLANDVKEGRLIPADRVVREAFESARVIREAILNLPARLASELAAETDTRRIYTRLDAELRQVLESCAQTLAG